MPLLTVIMVRDKQTIQMMFSSVQERPASLRNEKTEISHELGAPAPLRIGKTEISHELEASAPLRNGETEISHELGAPAPLRIRSEEHTSELQSRFDLVCRLLLEKKK